MSTPTGRPNLTQLKVQAKELVQAVKAGESQSIARVAPYFGKSSAFTLSDAQLVIARENGFESWPKLKRQLDQTPAKSLGRVLLDAIESGDEDQASELLKASPELAGGWHRTEYGWASPLHVAARLGRLTICQALIDAGAVVYAVNQGDYPPVFDAIYNKHKEVADLLMDTSAKTDSGQPPTFGCGIDIVLATRLGMLDRVRMHLKKDPLAVYRRGCIGETVLHWPSHNGYAEVVEYLLDNGALIAADEIGLYGGKPLHWASEHAPACVALLLNRGADPNARNLMPGDFEGFTPLHMMASQPNESIECAELLLKAGADPSLLDARGHTPLDVARERRRDRTVAFLTRL